MRDQLLKIFALFVGLLLSAAAFAQEPSPDAMTAARELVVAARVGDSSKELFGRVVQQLKPAIAKNKPEVERDFDAVLPTLIEAADAQMQALIEATARVYARNFTIDEMKTVTTFYRSPIGRKFLDKTPEVIEQSVVINRVFATRLIEDLKIRMIEELRKRGHSL